MRLFLLILLITVMIPGYGKCDDWTSYVLLECIDFMDFQWDSEKLETPNIGGEDCTIDWSEEVYLYRVFYPESGLPIILTQLSKGEWFYRDETVEQGQRYQYRIRATYNCPKAGKRNVTWQLFNNGVVELDDRCVGWLKRDLSLTTDFKELEMHVLNSAKLTISGSTLEEPLLRIHEGSTLDISGTTITTGRIEGEDSSTGGVVKITGENRFINSYVLFYSDSENEFSNSTIIGKSDVKDPPNYSVGLHIKSNANVTIMNSDIQASGISVRGTPQVEIRNNKFRTSQIEVNTATGHPPDKVQILDNHFSEGDWYIKSYNGGAVISDNSFADSSYHALNPAIHLYGGNVVFSNNQVVQGKIQIGGGYYDSADVTLENDLIIGAWPDEYIYSMGIDIKGGSTVKINSSTIMKHGTGIFINGEEGEQTDVTVRNSCIAGNKRGLVLSGSYAGPIPDTAVDVKSNWWGHATGPKNPDSNPDGQGNDCVWEGIDFEPWLTSNNCQSALGYVDPNGDCGGKTPCFNSIQAAINEASSGLFIWLTEPMTSIALNESKSLTLQGAWDSSFTSFKVRNCNTILTNAPW